MRSAPRTAPRGTAPPSRRQRQARRRSGRSTRNPSVTAGLKCAARDVADGRDHHGDHEAVRERHADQPASGHDRADADEGQGERRRRTRPRRAASVVIWHRRGRLGSPPDGAACAETPRAGALPLPVAPRKEQEHREELEPAHPHENDEDSPSTSLGKAANDPIGPRKPSPGPTFPSVVAVAEIASGQVRSTLAVLNASEITSASVPSRNDDEVEEHERADRSHGPLVEDA